MGKKKHKQKKNDAEDSSDDAAPSCSHIAKAVNFAAMRKALAKTTCTIGECTSCALESSRGGKGKGDNKASEGEGGEEEGMDTHTPTVWVCLQCGHQGCDRYSKEKHAVKHYETPHCGIHCLVINLTTWAIWCYACDNEVPLENKRIQECMDFLYKQSMKASSSSSSQSKKENTSQKTPLSNIEAEAQAQVANPSPAPVVITPQVVTKASDIACQRVKGLNNLGNTCFFNSVMQNLCQTAGLESLLTERCGGRDLTLEVRGWKDRHRDDESGSQSDSESDDQCTRLPELDPISIAMEEPGELSTALVNFVQEMSTQNGKNTISPNILFSNICKKASRFRGYQQQDSHELLRYLIDVVRGEEIKRAQAGILKHLKLDPKTVDEETKRIIKDYGRQVKFTFVDSMFGGQLVSTITCEECNHVSQVVESFLDLSLSVTEDKQQKANQMLGGRHNKDSGALPGKGKGGGEEEERTPAKGVDGFAEGSGKVSKYQERKNRKQAKRDAKKKGKNTKEQSGNKDNGKEEEEEEQKNNAEGKEEGKEQTARDAADDAQLNTGSQNSDDKHNSREEPSDADEEDNVESEVAAAMKLAGADNTQSNLPASSPTPSPRPHNGCESSAMQQPCNLLCDSDRDSPLDLDLKSGTQKETHILPQTYLQSADAHPHRRLSSDRESAGIKDKPGEIEKLDSDLCGLSLNDSGLGSRTEAGSEDLSTTGLSGSGGGGGDTGMDVSFSSTDFSRSGGRDSLTHSTLNNCDSDSSHTVGQCVGSLTENGFPPDNNTEQTSSIDSTFSHAPHNLGSVVDMDAGEKKPVWADFYKEARQKSKSTLAPRYQPASKECSVMSCLNQFTAAELLTGPNRVKCKECVRSGKASHGGSDKKAAQSVYSNASKQYLILIPPAILTLHFKRFEQVGFACRKVNRHVDFPALLDLAPYCSALCQEVKQGQGRVMYSLYGVVEHSGRLHGGHYTAYVKVRPGMEPRNTFLRSYLPQPYDFIHKYVDQLYKDAGADQRDSSDTSTPSTGSTEPVTVAAGRWFHVSDSSVSAVSEAKVFSAQAYLLFYERIE